MALPPWCLPPGVHQTNTTTEATFSYQLYPPPSWATPFSNDSFGSNPFASFWQTPPGYSCFGGSSSPFAPVPFPYATTSPMGALGYTMGGRHPAWDGYGGTLSWPSWDVNKIPPKDASADAKLNPWTHMAHFGHPLFGNYGAPFPFAMDEEEMAQQVVCQLINPSQPWSGHSQSAHELIQNIMANEKQKKAAIKILSRAVDSGGKHAAYCLPWLQYLTPDDMGDMVHALGHIGSLEADPAWHNNDPYLIIHAHYIHAAAAAAKDKKVKDAWAKFAEVHGNPKCTWPGPPAAIGWTFAQMFPQWDGDTKKVPNGWTAVIIPDYQLAQVNRR